MCYAAGLCSIGGIVGYAFCMEAWKNQPRENPFSPDFGEEPPALVGREELLSQLVTGLASGPGNPSFTSLLFGVRGSGKTVMLKSMRDSAEQNGWIVLSVSGSTGNLQSQIIESIDAAKEKYESAGPSAGGTPRDSRITAFSFAGVGLSWSHGEGPKRSAGRQLRDLAVKAQEAGTSVLLSVDELQGVDREDARELARDLQDIVKLDHLPLGFIGAALPELKYTLLDDKKITFLQRCHRLEMPPLTVAQALNGIHQPIRDSGGEIERAALRLAAESVGTSPYRLQAIGHACWTVAGAPHRPIERWAVEEGIREAHSLVTENIHIPAWYALGDLDQSYLTAVASLGGSATPVAIAKHTGAAARRLAESERRLVLSGYISKQTDRSISLTDLVPAEVIRQEAQIVSAYALADPSQVPQSAASSAVASNRCGHYMKRAKAKCVLVRGHKGGHRSRR